MLISLHRACLGVPQNAGKTINLPQKRYKDWRKEFVCIVLFLVSLWQNAFFCFYT